MSNEAVSNIMASLQSGVSPLLRLSVRRGKDSRLIRVTDTDTQKFYCVYADTIKEETFSISHSSIKHGTFVLTEVR